MTHTIFISAMALAGAYSFSPMPVPDTQAQIELETLCVATVYPADTQFKCGDMVVIIEPQERDPQERGH